jgi:hypothetical protein
MTYIKLQGGLGNQLFQVAAAFAYSKKHKTELYLDASEWHGSQGKNGFEYQNTIFKNFKYDQRFCGDVEFPIYYNEKRFNYDPIPKYNLEEYGASHLSISGYFQSLKYFQDYKDEFIEMLELPNPHYHPEPDDVGIHIRRGDYLVHSHIHHVCDYEYFTNALDLFPEAKNVNIFTDAKDTSRDGIFQLGDSARIIDGGDELIDFTLLSRHANIIASNSSFSWWASLIGEPKNKIVVPKIWFKNFENHDDIYRDEFIRI